MRTIFVLVFLTSLCLLLCCTSSKDSQNDFKTIKVEYHETVNLSQLVEPDFEYLLLENEEDTPIGYFQRIIFQDDRIYVLDGSSKLFFCFDGSGKFLFKGGSVGNGPGEYTNPEDMAVTNDEIIIYDLNSLSFYMFDKSTGDFSHEASIGLWMEEFIPFDTNHLLLYSPSDYIRDDTQKESPPNILKVVDADLDLKASYLPYIEVVDDAASPGVLHQFEDAFSFSRMVTGEIYSLDKDFRFHKRYEIDFGPYNWPLDIKTMGLDQEKMEAYYFKGEVMTMTHRLLEDQEYFTFQAYKMDEPEVREPEERDKWWGMYSKSQEVCYVIHQVFNDLDGGHFSFPRGMDGDRYVSVIEPEFLQYSVGEDTNDVLKKQLDSLKAQLNERSNPVLMKFQLKEDVKL